MCASAQSSNRATASSDAQHQCSEGNSDAMAATRRRQDDALAELKWVWLGSAVAVQLAPHRDTGSSARRCRCVRFTPSLVEGGAKGCARDLIGTSLADVLEPFSALGREPRWQRKIPLMGLAAARRLGHSQPRQAVPVMAGRLTPTQQPTNSCTDPGSQGLYPVTLSPPTPVEIHDSSTRVPHCVSVHAPASHGT